MTLSAKPTVVDLFAGCGGFSLGLERAGYETVFVNELHSAALATFLGNRQGSGLENAGRHCNDIRDLTRRPGELSALAARLRQEHGGVDLVVGGPPCQGFSGIGHRRSFSVARAEIPSNHLYHEMAAVIESLKPRAFVFENVRGLLTARWTPNGEKGEIWHDVCETFTRIGATMRTGELAYEIRPALVRSKDYGVPQNRPRVLLVGLRSDVPFSFDDQTGVAAGLLPLGGERPPDLADLLDDLAYADWEPGGNAKTYRVDPQNEWQQGLRTLRSGETLGAGGRLAEHDYARHSERIIRKFTYMLANGGAIPDDQRTKKFAQRVLPAYWDPDIGPTITATSLPDDYVHYSLPRIPTVREWARLQTFPDWYRFAGRRTTGGRRRAGDPSTGNWERDMPKYTQIGNAVPPLLGTSIGLHLREILGK